MDADKCREEQMIRSGQDRAPIGASVFRALPFLLICVHLRPSAVKLFFNCLVPAKSPEPTGVPSGFVQPCGPVPILLLCFALLLPTRTPAQSLGHPAAADWGPGVQGVQLSISLTNNIFQVGSSATVESVTQNSSTNDIVVDIFAPTVVFDVVLTNSAGKSYHITTPMRIRGPSQFVTIKPGDNSAESIPVTFGQTRFGDTVEPGEYTLLATRHFSFVTHDLRPGDEAELADLKLESNVLKVRVR
jgi:hypothetical protein